MSPFVSDPDFVLHVGDALEVLATLPDESVHCVVTSPPYWGLRDYGTEGQLGLEPTPEEYVSSMVAVFREVRRVLRRDGTCWLNIGDSYGTKGSDWSKWKGGQTYNDRDKLRGASIATGLKPKDLVGIPWRLAFALQADEWYLRSDIIWSKPNPMPESVTDRPTKAHEYLFLLTKSPRYFYDADAIREEWSTMHAPGSKVNETQHYGAGNGGNSGLTKHLADVKARLRTSPQDETLDGLYECVRCGVVKTKTIESAENGCGACDGELVLVTGEAPRGPDGRRATAVKGADGSIQHRDGERWPNGGRNKRSVWEIATEPYPDAHFATFPQALVEPCVLAGTSERGCCPVCGAPWEREVQRLSPVDPGHLRPEIAKGNPHRNDGDRRLGRAVQAQLDANPPQTIGWRPTCEHEHEPVPATIFDPFMGSGTVAVVARRLGRRAVGIELNPEYALLASKRLAQLSLLAA